MNLSCILKNCLGNPLHVSLALCCMNDNAGPEGSVAEWCDDSFWLEIVGAEDLLMQPWAVYFTFSFISSKWKCCTSWAFFFSFFLFAFKTTVTRTASLLCFTFHKPTAELL